MSSILSLLLTLVGLFLFVQFIILVMITSRLVKMVMWAPLVIPVPREQLPDDFRQILDYACPTLEQEGFVYTQTLQERSIMAIQGRSLDYHDVYYHPEKGILAEVQPTTRPSQHRPFTIYLWNFFTDGRALLTCNGIKHSLVIYPDTITIVDPYAPDFPSQCLAHLTMRDNLPGVRLDRSAQLNFRSELAVQLFPWLVAHQLCYQRGEFAGESIYSYRLWPAIRFACRMRMGNRHLAYMNAAPKSGQPDKRPPLAPDEVQTANERIAFINTLITLEMIRAPTWFRHGVLVISALVFLALGAWLWGVVAVASIGIVILLHEGGHWAAMKWAGFRDVQVFFVPGLGGATSGEKHEARSFTHLAVYLAGPIPGILLALIGMGWLMSADISVDQPEFHIASIFIMAALWINAFNLLPVSPLDGGRIVELFIGRLPWLRFAFSGASSIAFLMLGIFGGDTVIRALGILLLFSLPQQYRVACAEQALLKAQLTGTSTTTHFSEAARKLYHLLSLPAYKRWNFDQKITTGRALLPRIFGHLPKTWEILIGVAIYLFCIGLPIIGLIGFMSINPPATIAILNNGLNSNVFESETASTDSLEKNEDSIIAEAQAEKERRAAMIAAASTPEAKIQRLLEAVGTEENEGNYQAAQQHAEAAYALSKQLPAHNLQLIRIELILVSLDGEAHKEKLVEAEQLARILAQSGQPDHLALLAEVLTYRNTIEEDQHDQPRVALAAEIVELLDRAGKDFLLIASEARLRWAKELRQAQEYSQAIALLRNEEQQWQKQLTSNTFSEPNFPAILQLQAIRRMLVEILLDNGQYSAAEAICKTQLNDQKDSNLDIALSFWKPRLVFSRLKQGVPSDAITIVRTEITPSSITERIGHWLGIAHTRFNSWHHDLALLGWSAAKMANDPAAEEEFDMLLKLIKATNKGLERECKPVSLHEEQQNSVFTRYLRELKYQRIPCSVR